MKELKKEREKTRLYVASIYCREVRCDDAFSFSFEEKLSTSKRRRNENEIDLFRRGRVKFRNEWNNDTSSFSYSLSPWSSSSLSSSSPPTIVRHVPGDRVQDLMKASKIVKFLHAWTDGWVFKIFWVERWGHPAYHLSISIISEERNNNAPTCVVDCLPGQVVTGQASRLSFFCEHLFTYGSYQCFQRPNPLFRNHLFRCRF